MPFQVFGAITNESSQPDKRQAVFSRADQRRPAHGPLFQNVDLAYEIRQVWFIKISSHNSLAKLPSIDIDVPRKRKKRRANICTALIENHFDSGNRLRNQLLFFVNR